MQLPRGTFRSIRKGILLGDILDECKSSRFNGTCSFSSGTIRGTLVFKTGGCILAEVENLSGDEAWIYAISLKDRMIDVAFSDLDRTQLQLAMDFNIKAHTGQSGSREPGLSETISQGHSQQVKKGNIIPRPPSVPSGISEKAILPNRDLSSTRPEPESEHIQKNHLIPVEPDPALAKDEFDVFEETDFNDIALKMRTDSKSILKKLQLDHLIEK